MTSTRLDGKRVLLTQSNDFMGPALTAVFNDSGAEVIGDPRALDQDPELPAAIVREAGRVDVLLIHLALPAPSTPAGEISDVEWRTVFAHLVDPMPRLVAAVLPQTVERRSGRILVMGSAQHFEARSARAPTALQEARNWPMCSPSRWSWCSTAFRSTPSRRTSLPIRPTTARKCRPTRDFRSGSSEKFRWTLW